MTRAPIPVSLLLILTLKLPAAPDRDFTGSWKLKADRSEIHVSPAPPAKLMRVDQEGKYMDVKCFGTPGERPISVNFTTDGTESKNRVNGAVRSSVAKWEGSALLIHTIVSQGSTNFTEMDRWKLSHEGRTLIIRRQIVDRHGENESTLVYERE